MDRAIFFWVFLTIGILIFSGCNLNSEDAEYECYSELADIPIFLLDVKDLDYVLVDDFFYSEFTVDVTSDHKDTESEDTLLSDDNASSDINQDADIIIKDIGIVNDFALFDVYDEADLSDILVDTELKDNENYDTGNCTSYIQHTSSNGKTGRVVSTQQVIDSSQNAIWSYDMSYDMYNDRFVAVYFSAGSLNLIYLSKNGGIISQLSRTISVGSIFNPRIAVSDRGIVLICYTKEIQSGLFSKLCVFSENDRLYGEIEVKKSLDFSLTYRAGLLWNDVLNQFIVLFSDISPYGNEWGRISTYAIMLYEDGRLSQNPILVADAVQCADDKWEKRVLGEIATGKEGSSMVVGFGDSTSDYCKALGGLWYRFINNSGEPVGDTGIVQGVYDTDLHREHRIVFSPLSNTYLVLWVRSGSLNTSIWGQRFDQYGERLGESYIVAEPNLCNNTYTDDKIGQTALAYDPQIDRYEVLARGHDNGNGVAPLFRFRLGSDALPFDVPIETVYNDTVDPSPIIVSDNKGRIGGIFRVDYSHLYSVIIDE